MHARYEKNPETPTSWHFTVDEKEIYQHLPLNENGWHAGDGGTGNRKSIGIEICENDGDFEKAVANTPMADQKANEGAYGKVKYQDMTAEEKDVINDFEGWTILQ